MKNLFLFASILLASGVLFTNIYNSMVDVRSWGADIPQSIEAARQYFKSANPGDFFRIFSPINQVLGLVVLILFWKTHPGSRLYLGVALVIYVLGDVITFTYFYPRNDIMFKTASLTDIDTIKKVWQEWNSMNWVRSFIIFVGLICSCLALHKIYFTNSIRQKDLDLSRSSYQEILER